MAELHSQETDSQWMRRLAGDSDSDASQDSFFDDHYRKKEARPTSKAPQIREEAARTNEVMREKEGRDEKENRDSMSESDGEEMEEEERRSESEESGEENEKKRDSQSSSVVPDSQEKNEEEEEGKKKKHDVPESDEPKSRMARMRFELAHKIENVIDMTSDLRAIVRSQFDLMLSLTSPETPPEVWSELLADYAANREEFKEGKEYVKKEHPRLKKTKEEKIEAHRKLARMVVTRMVQKEIKAMRRSIGKKRDST